MNYETDPYNGLNFYELSHVWGHGAPSYPGNEDVIMYRSVKHGQHGVMTNRLKMVMHTGTHMNAPIHMIQGGAGLADIPLECLFGTGVILHIPKKKWGLISIDDLKNTEIEIQNGDFVVLVTGWHQKYSDSLEYFGESPGISKEGAEFLVSKNVKLVAIDTPQIDHPLATSLAGHRGGPLMNRLEENYAKETGNNPKKDHPEWNVAHKILLGAGVPTIEQVGGHVDSLKNTRATFIATPWRWVHGDACPVRLVAIIDPSGNNRLESGG